GTADQDAVDAATAALTEAIAGLNRRSGSGSGSSGSGSSGGSGSGSAAGGSWIKDNTGWWYRNPDGSYPVSNWKFINSRWYYFGGDGYMKTGWVLDGNAWYYLDAAEGHMLTGWHQDPNDGCWYYLDLATGAMLTGWQNINGSWYFFHDVAPAEPTWTYEESSHTWRYTNAAYRPYGSMYASESTPDGYSVGSDGVRVP
ncbi:MAG: hypothetical protein LUC94_11170, partial [Clostridiales bacterium]|nr:hypothetical protein [Clostridiales bacterium]